MEITVNGQQTQVDADLSAAQLIDKLGLTGKRLAMEVNEEIVPGSGYATFRFKAHDRIEIVHAIGGG